MVKKIKINIISLENSIESVHLCFTAKLKEYKYVQIIQKFVFRKVNVKTITNRYNVLSFIT